MKGVTIVMPITSAKENAQRRLELLKAVEKRFGGNAATKKTHPCAKRNMVPRAVLMKSGLVSVKTVRQVNAAHSKTTVNVARPMSYLFKTAYSTVKRPIHKNTTFKNSNVNQRVNTVRAKNVNTARPKAVVNAVKEIVLVLLRRQLIGFGNQRLKF
nr:hypothetical protein [Tanacetum cinerariifolium]